MLMGVISAFATTFGCIAFAYIMSALTGGIPVTTTNMTPDIQTVDSFFVPIILIIGGVISALISFFILRYSFTKFLISYLPISITIYAALFFVVQSIDINKTPLNSWDYLLYYIILFPVGAAVGTITSIIINQVRNHRK